MTRISSAGTVPAGPGRGTKSAKRWRRRQTNPWGGLKPRARTGIRLSHSLCGRCDKNIERRNCPAGPGRGTKSAKRWRRRQTNPWGGLKPRARIGIRLSHSLCGRCDKNIERRNCPAGPGRGTKSAKRWRRRQTNPWGGLKLHARIAIRTLRLAGHTRSTHHGLIMQPL